MNRTTRYWKTRVAACSSNLHEVGEAFQLYLQEHDNNLPQRVYGSVIVPSLNVQLGYDELLLSYTGNESKIFQCPAQSKHRYPDEPSYGMNWYYDNTTAMRVENMSTTILVTDTRGDNNVGSHRADRNSGSPGQLDTQRHSGRANYLFFDGHVELLQWQETVTPRDPWGIDYNRHDEQAPAYYTGQ